MASYGDTSETTCAAFEREHKEETPGWITTLCNQINERDRRERDPFEAVAESYASILRENVELNSRVYNLSQALTKFKQDQWYYPLSHPPPSPQTKTKTKTKAIAIHDI